MLQKSVHMRDQINNRIEIIMQDDEPSFLYKAEEFSVAVLLVLIFVLGASL